MTMTDETRAGLRDEQFAALDADGNSVIVATRRDGDKWRTAPARVKREPLTYEPHKQVSFFRDLARSKLSDPGALDRLDAHRREMDVERRTNPNLTAGTGGEFGVPLWLIPLTGVGIAGPRVIADLIAMSGNLYDLPGGIDEVDIPTLTTGALEQVQPAPGDGGAKRSEATSSGKSPVVTVDGSNVVSQQLLDRVPAPGLDAIMLKDLTASYNTALETQLANGTGTNGQLTGLTNVTSAIKVAAGSGIVPANLNGATPMISGLWFVLGSMQAQLANGRQQPGQHWIMAPRRWASIAFSTDLQDMPISSPGHEALELPEYPKIGGATAGTLPVGPIGGCPVWQSAALGPVDNTSTATAATDTILLIRPDDLLMWESAPRFQATQDPLSGTLQVRLQMYRYVAAVLGRYPSGIAAATGLVQPTTGLTGWSY